MTGPTVRVRNLPDGCVMVELDDGRSRVAVEMPWRDALGVVLRLSMAMRLAATQELTDSEFDALFTAMSDQTTAEVMTQIRGAR